MISLFCVKQKKQTPRQNLFLLSWDLNVSKWIINNSIGPLNSSRRWVWTILLLNFCLNFLIFTRIHLQNGFPWLRLVRKQVLLNTEMIIKLCYSKIIGLERSPRLPRADFLCRIKMTRVLYRVWRSGLFACVYIIMTCMYNFLDLMLTSILWSCLWEHKLCIWYRDWHICTSFIY